MKKILVIDDDLAILDSVKFILEDAGYRVLGLSGEEDIENEVVNFSPDLILLDIWLPSISGLEIAKRLKNSKETKAIPIILISALSDAGKEVSKSNVEAFIAKPFSLDELLNKVEKYII